ncbi:SanA/YdcF family protein [Planotetraspora kaengkrachanensis]|uniref:Membrane protein n=1 Tax=Planotetraspora kaengkrachanensis TaxID=575193 RepID=A0A8J3PXB8_9ACTN|nr:ElyC/SanA/YdcF family protein [Planotetraspora kaengkrachanensis]GIG82862.1 membrane protein [Planotetraspora kaengkrachanensis]
MIRLPRPPWSRATQRTAFQIVVVLSLLSLAPITWAWLDSAPHRVVARPGADWIDSVPVMPAALVLGAGIGGDRPTPMLRSRLDLAARLYQTGKIRAILVSGDNSRAGYDEPTVMRDYLVTRGIPVTKIALDYAGFDTWDSCVRANKIFGATRLIVVTQEFHLPRAVALCRTAGMETFGVGDDSSRDWPLETAVYAAREIPAAAKALLNSLVLNSSPRFLGPRESALDDALAR